MFVVKMKLHRNLAEAVITNLEEIFVGNRYADKVIEKSLKLDRRWGSRDRRFIAEVTYDIVRWYRLYSEITENTKGDPWPLLGAWCIMNKAELPDWEVFKSISKKRLAKRLEEVQSNRPIRESIPDWLDALCEKELGARWDTELHALNEKARLVIRANTVKTSRDALKTTFKALGIETDVLREAPDALVLGERQNIFTLQEFKDGLFEVQDAGSQRIAPFVDAKPGMRVIDACAGGGGKTLHLAALMQNKGRIVAMDTEDWKLEELKKRARRAGVSNVIEARLIDSSKVIKRLEASADRVLLDVPCSGLGVLRRNPDAKWKLAPEFIEEVKAKQQEILSGYSQMVKPGGQLVYSTCSILLSENEAQVQKFIEFSGGKFKLEAEQSLMPSEGFDGFYMARITRLP
jgi:16S rRNA (cytosine967-C5)-methyltransferase